ncbi:glucan 4-alpha-glucosidase [Cordyceps militaris]|uniref:Glucan 4-alpha-glucosidase n=1 Tax=Cordyceps militaris TaxID=73501 RepID=A0A2H4SRB4_CORMI|nr:glucan 4-alpha-glucosidase [Cordyceps militaris]
MDNSRRTSAGSRRQRSSSTSSNASTASTASFVTEEDYDLLASAAIPDGFRPSGPVPNLSAIRRPLLPLSGPLLPPPQAVNPSFSKWNHRPSSVAKAPRPHDSLAIRADGSNASNTAQTPGGGVPPLRGEAPYRGPSNPAHQYGMYPQRTASNATDRSARANRPSSYTGPRGPTHPYTLYTQGTAAAPVEANQQAIPVGFTGLAAPYERQIGPDGEDIGDLLGPLGHTEELPPYSRYPEVAFSTKPAPGAAVVIRRSPSSAQNTHLEEASGSGSAPTVAAVPETLDNVDAAPENPFASADDDLGRATSRQSRHSIRTVSTYRDNPSSDESYSEKAHPIQTKWQRRARRKLWGVIPYWSICLLFVGLILGSIMGAVVGTVLTKGRSSKQQQTKPTPEPDHNPTPTVVDIQPLPTVPNALLPLPVGRFSLPQMDGGGTSKLCVNDSRQLAAWSCNMAFRFYSVDVSPDAGRASIERYNLTLKPINSTQSQLLWGTQPPYIKDPVKLRLVNDSMQGETRGPAWWTSVSYDKTVVVRQEDLSPMHSKRNWVYPGLPATIATANSQKSRFSRSKYQPQPGDCMWICTWPQTVLEILIYPGQNVTTDPGPPTGPSLTMSPVPSRTSSPQDDSNFGNFDLNQMPQDPLAPYPKLVRLIERRTANSRPATCFGYEMNSRGNIVPQTNPQGDANQIQISENVNTVHRMDRSPGPYNGPRGREDRDMQVDGSGIAPRESLEFTPCSCFWSQ